MSNSPTDADAIRHAVALLLDRIIAHPDLVRYWVGVDEPRLRRHARDFILQALGGPQLYEGDIRAAHQALGIDDADFALVADELLRSLREVGVSEGVVALVAQRVDELRPVIVTA